MILGALIIKQDYKSLSTLRKKKTLINQKLKGKSYNTNYISEKDHLKWYELYNATKMLNIVEEMEYSKKRNLSRLKLGEEQHLDKSIMNIDIETEIKCPVDQTNFLL